MNLKVKIQLKAKRSVKTMRSECCQRWKRITFGTFPEK